MDPVVSAPEPLASQSHAMARYADQLRELAAPSAAAREDAQQQAEACDADVRELVAGIAMVSAAPGRPLPRADIEYSGCNIEVAALCTKGVFNQQQCLSLLSAAAPGIRVHSVESCSTGAS